MRKESHNPFAPSLSDLGQVTTLDEAERDQLVQTSVAPDPIPFGYLFPDWQRMKEQMQVGDKLQYYHREFGDGLALVRDGTIITWIGCGIPRHKRS